MIEPEDSLVSQDLFECVGCGDILDIDSSVADANDELFCSNCFDRLK